MTEDVKPEDDATVDHTLVELIERSVCVVLELKGVTKKKAILGPDLHARLVRLLKAGLEKP